MGDLVRERLSHRFCNNFNDLSDRAGLPSPGDCLKVLKTYFSTPENERGEVRPYVTLQRETDGEEFELCLDAEVFSADYTDTAKDYWWLAHRLGITEKECLDRLRRAELIEEESYNSLVRNLAAEEQKGTT